MKDLQADKTILTTFKGSRLQLLIKIKIQLKLELELKLKFMQQIVRFSPPLAVLAACAENNNDELTQLLQVTGLKH
jgi:hypothetical protein